MVDSKSKKLKALIIGAIIVLGVILIGLISFREAVFPNQLEVNTTQTAERGATDIDAESGKEPPTAIIPPTETLAPTATGIPTQTPTDTKGPRTTISITPELFIYHTP